MDPRSAHEVTTRARRRLVRRAARPLRRYRYGVVERTLGRRRAAALFAFANGALAIGVMGTIAHLASAPLIFPSLGPTAYLVFAHPLAAPASPRNAVLGHAIGAAAGAAMLLLFGLADEPDALATGVTWGRVGAAALALGLTSGTMVLLRTNHAPAGATTLIVAMGMMTGTARIAALMLAVVLLVGQAWAIHRLAGIPYPVWSSVRRPAARAPRPEGR